MKLRNVLNTHVAPTQPPSNIIGLFKSYIESNL